MAGQRSNRILVRGAEHALDQFKYEVAREIGIQIPPDGYFGDYPSRQCGAMGGYMVRRMIQDAELRLAQGAMFTGNVGGVGTVGLGGYGTPGYTR